ncbi:D-sedoheptulose 7-phosphate isomerase [Paraglaciecola sp.]|uniref:D-sedoheptulose 7-phosphate isomerase n=1 Tax=Paraglaciecola sp. TaxID=1920173 RepID=UPI00273E3282|nr:D-sedoheptulose 7-phosphate isomerase [Paraglaciecola sp.]MDP5030512.1 D-sedoheptulose 7-phosphate isomerase [Paraglaciecola sp.]
MDSLTYVKAHFENSVATKQAILNDLGLQQRIVDAAEACIAALKNGNKILFAGNGGSAADSQHLAAELVSRFNFDRPGLPSIALTTDTSMLTAIGNDYGFLQLFARQVQANGREGDVFVGISTSGNSANILEAVKVAKGMNIVTIALCGNAGKLPEVCDVTLNVPSTSTPFIQESHIAVGHVLCGLIEEAMFGHLK